MWKRRERKRNYLFAQILAITATSSSENGNRKQEVKYIEV